MADSQVSIDQVLAYLGTEYVHRLELEKQVASLRATVVKLSDELETLKKHLA